MKIVRSFSSEIVMSQEFLNLTPSARALYYTLNMAANQYGQIVKPMKLVEKYGTMTDFETLINLDYIIWSAEDWAVIKGWYVNNCLPYEFSQDEAKLNGLGFTSDCYYKILPQFKKHSLPTEDDFERVWKAYPRHSGTSKQQAKKAYLACGASADILIKAIEIEKRKKQWSDIQFIPHLSTWIHQKRWETVNEEENDGLRRRAECAAESSTRWNISYDINGAE